MSLRRQSQSLDGEKMKKHSFRRVWKDVAIVGDMQVQRLSRMAIIERQRTCYRFRIVRDGQVVAQHATREEAEEALGNPASLFHNDALAETLKSVPGSPRLPPPPESPQVPSHVDVQPAVEPPKPMPVIEARVVPPPVEARVTSVSPERDTTPLQVKRDRRLLSVQIDRSIFPDEPDVSMDDPKAPPAPTPMGMAAARKALMSPELRAQRRRDLRKPVEPSQQPMGPAENATGWYYDEEANEWGCRELVVHVADVPFAEGAMRKAFHMTIDGEPEGFVAKTFNEATETEVISPNIEAFNGHDPDRLIGKGWMLRMLGRKPGSDFEVSLADRLFHDTDRLTTRQFLTMHRRLKLFKADAEMQGFCRTYAKEYNKLNPPKEVLFLDAFLVVMHERPEHTLYSCEPLIAGDFVKHNSNTGVARQNERNTPQAFSHFTYCFSGGKHIIVDIQGVGDTYTDPQVHSIEGRFGMGNLGQDGINAFFNSHQCNEICVGLGLKPYEGLQSLPSPPAKEERGDV